MAQNEVIVISDEEDSVNQKTSEITSIVISDGEDEVVESMKTRGDVNERNVISSPAKSEPCRPLKKFKFSENGVKKLQAQVKLIDIGNWKKPLKLSPVKKETGEGVATSSAESEETSSSVDQVRIRMERFLFFPILILKQSFMVNLLFCHFYSFSLTAVCILRC